MAYYETNFSNMCGTSNTDLHRWSFRQVWSPSEKNPMVWSRGSAQETCGLTPSCGAGAIHFAQKVLPKYARHLRLKIFLVPGIMYLGLFGVFFFHWITHKNHHFFGYLFVDLFQMSEKQQIPRKRSRTAWATMLWSSASSLRTITMTASLRCPLVDGLRKVSIAP